MSEGEDERVDGSLESLARQVSHGNVDVARVDPPAPYLISYEQYEQARNLPAVGMEREPLWQHPEFRRSWVHTSPVVHVEDGQPELAPGRNCSCTTVEVQCRASSDHHGFVCVDSEYSEDCDDC